MPTDVEGFLPRISDAPAAHYPIPCPRCHRVAGKPIAVSTIETRVSFTVELTCSKCHHRWAEVISRVDA